MGYCLIYLNVIPRMAKLQELQLVCVCVPLCLWVYVCGFMSVCVCVRERIQLDLWLKMVHTHLKFSWRLEKQRLQPLYSVALGKQEKYLSRPRSCC